MKYKEYKTTLNEVEYEFIIIEREDGSFKSFPADENNSEYQAFLENIDQYELVKESE